MENKKDYHKNNLHNRLIKEIALRTELEYNNNNFQISEYDIQKYFCDFLKINFKNTKIKVQKEKCGKIDCVISYNEEPIIIYEIKSFSKLHEKINTNTAKETIFKDLIKIKNKIQEFKKSRGYMVIAMKRSDYNKLVKNNNNELSFIIEHYNNNKRNIKLNNEITLRPSSKKIIDKTYVFSWEIK